MMKFLVRFIYLQGISTSVFLSHYLNHLFILSIHVNIVIIVMLYCFDLKTMEKELYYTNNKLISKLNI